MMSRYAYFIFIILTLCQPCLSEDGPQSDSNVTIWSYVDSIKSPVTTSDFRELGKKMTKDQVSSLDQAFTEMAENPSSPETVDEVYDIIGRVYIVNGINVIAHKDIFSLAPIYLIAGLSEHATSEIISTVTKFQNIALEALSQREKEGRIELDRETEQPFIKKSTAYNSVMREALEALPSNGYVNLGLELSQMALQSPYVSIRWNGIVALKGIVSKANARGNPLMPETELWNYLEQLERNERSFLDATSRAYTVSPRESREIIRYIEDIRDELDPLGVSHYISPKPKVIMTFTETTLGE